ncbi:protein of unknown function [Bradyrhizobium vignae]|uniref:Uncharacterized protein n=1 Tax=Bradyrhizobium vignae TaxID=1549949 RepID=A0A2U3PVN8_9BRAD|nr:protein of unknown function [Bradyrhizobium vignae]
MRGSTRWAREGDGVNRSHEILSLVRYTAVAELHNADGVRRYVVIAQDKLANPEVATPKDSPYGKALCVRLQEAAFLDFAPAPDAFA